MRFVELRPTPQGEGFRLHPRITFLRGLDPAARVAVVGMAHDVALGQTPDWDGTAELNGAECPLHDAVDRMGETAESALIMPAESLPTVAGPGEADPAAAIAAHEQAVARVAELESRTTELAEELEASGGVRADMKRRLATAQGRIDDEAGRALDRADGALGRAARQAGRPDPWTGRPDREERIAELHELRSTYETELEGLPSGDRPALAAAIATARAAISTGAVASPEAAALAQAWMSLHQRLRGLQSRMEAGGGGSEAVAARLEAARAEARVAEDAAMARKVTPEEEAHLERLHEEMLDAERKASRGVRRGSGRVAFDLAVETLQDALDPLGYPTWAAFRMGNGMVCVTPEATERYEKATEDLERAEAEWTELMERIDNDTEFQEVLTAIDDSRERARELLDEMPAGGDDDPTVITEALKAVTVDADSIEIDPEEAIRHLRRTMDAAGAIGHADIRSEAAMVVLGDSWLDVLEMADEAAVRIQRDQERITAELEAFDEMGDGSRVDRLDDERTAVRDAEEAVAVVRAALGEQVRARLELHVLAATELTIAQEHDDTVTELESARVLLELAEQRLEGRPAVDAASQLAPRVPRGVCGPIPMVVVMGNAPASKLDVLTAMPDDVQIVVVGDGVGLEEWIDSVGPDVASVVEARALV